jgi:uncharacterized coiled-coil protein SlyX
MTECERSAWLQQQVADRDRFIQIDRSIIAQRDAEIERLNKTVAFQEDSIVQHKTMLDTLTGEVEQIRSAAKSILWMAREYAEGGGRGGPEMRDYRRAESAILGTPLEDDDSEDD